VSWVFILISLAAFAAAIGFGLRKFARTVQKYTSAARRSTIASARGYVEITGLARAIDGAPTKNPLTGSPCIWWRAWNERPEDIDRPDDEHQSRDPILIDDGTGACAVEIDTLQGFGEREVVKSHGFGAFVIRKIQAGTRLYAIGRIQRLAVPERGATHRLSADGDMRLGISLRPLEQTARHLPTMKKISLGAFLVSGVLLLVAIGYAALLWTE
jgi:hypothetical protein